MKTRYTEEFYKGVFSRSQLCTIKGTLFIFLISTVMSLGCTVVRDGSNLDDGGKVGIAEPAPLEERHVNVLIFGVIDQSTLAQHYSFIIGSLIGALQTQNVIADRVAIAPMYRRISEQVPLLFGLDDPEAEFNTYEEALQYYSDERESLLTESTLDDGANVTALGARLGVTEIYHPTSSADTGRYYFDEPRDGTIIVWLNPLKRRCGLGDCEVDGQSLANILTDIDENGAATWITLGGDVHPLAQKVIHFFVGTAEDVSEERFFETCGNQPAFPANILDFIEPSIEPLYTDLIDHLNGAQVPALSLDFCEALSAVELSPLLRPATRIRAVLDRPLR